MNILTIDAGTTNTRVSVWRDDVFLCQAASQIGVRDTALSGGVAKLQTGVRETIASALSKANLAMVHVQLILASGMITSNVGLHEIPHLSVEAGCQELANGMQQVQIDEVCPHPIWFIPGVRNVVDNIGLHNFEAMDMMRGEEVETMGLVTRLGLTQPTLVMLPGSHTKWVQLNAQQRISGCVTTLAGELLQTITHNTLLAGALGSAFATEINTEMLLAGARMEARMGLGRACFAVRTLEQFTPYDRNARANFLLGAVLGADLLTLKNSSALCVNPDTSFVIAGIPLLRAAMGLLVQDDPFFNGPVTIVSDEQQVSLAGFGAITVARQRGLLTPTQPKNP